MPMFLNLQAFSLFPLYNAVFEQPTVEAAFDQATVESELARYSDEMTNFGDPGSRTVYVKYRLSRGFLQRMIEVSRIRSC